MLLSIAKLAASVAALLASLVPHGATVTVNGDGSWSDVGPAIPPAVATELVVDAPPLQEDDPGWDCATQGNRQCSAVITEPVHCADTDGFVFTYGGPTSGLPTICWEN